MADEQYRWLDRDAAERLLRGEPLDAVDDETRARAAALAEALAALSATPPPTSAELPGEAAALAAFRAARTSRDGAEATLGRTAFPRPAVQSADAVRRGARTRGVRVGRRDAAAADAHSDARRTGDRRLLVADARRHVRRAPAGQFLARRGGRRIHRDRPAGLR
ncbi:hypothetical protein [Streptomyces sp. TP-A0356]|uniref:hypothetical protein n=1 Tax=Streptomyces sp. TP-A0356 TaxID=1359208 RepID=UPI0006E24DB3|nr:hypothetical protein [Streptomyces sp. TP-A0356]